MDDNPMQYLFFFNILSARAMALACALFSSASAMALIDYPGRIDDTFGNTLQGFTGTRLGSSNASLSSIALQPDGKILIGGRCSLPSSSSVFQICVGRLSAAGIPDSTYGNAGVFRLSENGFSASYGGFLAALPNGSAYVAGTCGDTTATLRLCVARLDANGNKDTSFGASGFVDLTGFSGDPKAVLVRKSGKIVVLGECNLAICIVQVSDAGVVEIGFRTTWGPSSGINVFRPLSLAEDANGRLVIGGTCITTSSEIRGCAMRYYALDGVSGGSDPLRVPYVWSTSEQSDGNALAVLPDGAWLLAGACRVGGVRRFCVRRLLANGSLDSAFGNAGVAVLPFTGLDNFAQTISIQPDGKIVLAGSCRTASATEPVYCTVRLHQDGRFDTSYGINRDGRELTTLDSFAAFVSAATLQADGSHLVGGGGGEMRVFRQSGAFSGRRCDFDVDGDGIAGTSTDFLLASRAAMGYSGAAVVQGISFAPQAKRTSWPLIRSFLVAHCDMSLVP